MRTLWLLFYILTSSFIHGRHIVNHGGVANQADFDVEDSKTVPSVEDAENTFFRWFTHPRHSYQADGNYCTIDFNHTMCLYQGPSETCSEMAISRGLTDDARQTVLDEHNQYRSRVANGEEPGQPPAANMRMLVWNDELEKIAQRWADQCIYNHDQIRNKLNFDSVGQNLYTSSFSRQESADDVQNTVIRAVELWYNEVTNPGFSPENIDPFRFEFPTGHYSQVVWAETSELGCGLTYYQDTDGWYKTLIVCNYAISGNMQNVPMYITGAAGSRCPEDTQANEDGLCQ